MSEALVLAGIGIAATSGIPGLLAGRRATGAQHVSAGLAFLASIFGLSGIAVFWVGGTSRPIVWQWVLPGAAFDVAMDGLSAVFLAPVFLVSLLGSVYGLDYWKQTDHPESGRKLRFFYGTLTAAMAMLVIARNSVLFLFGWEIMAVSAFFLVTTEDWAPEVRSTGWLYLATTHVATLFLFALFALLRAASGSFALRPLSSDALSPPMATVLFVIALVGFGIKAGIMPLHIWLPSSHAIAPSHVSAIMSGVIIKMGLYGLFRFTSMIPNPPIEWGSVILSLGVISGVFGVAFAIGQHDIKRLLAYHSIENIGIIAMGLGLAMIGRSLGRSDWIVLGLAGALLHVWNHALFKALLFLSAGSVIFATGSREMERLGGLAKGMPLTASCFLTGAIAICGLPPLNGFVSELMIFLGLFGTLGADNEPSFAGGAFAAAALALIGALALACFVKAYGIVFLGTARTADARQARESPRKMIASMVVLVVCCAVIGLFPILITPVLGDGIAAWAADLRNPASRLGQLAPLGAITGMGLTLIVALVGFGVLLQRLVQRNGIEAATTWGCGYAEPTPSMQYTSSSFSQLLVHLFGWALRPRVHRPGRLPLFPGPTSFKSEVPDTVLDEVVLPTLRFGAWTVSWFRVFHGGSAQAYLLYIFLTLIGLLLLR